MFTGYAPPPPDGGEDIADWYVNLVAQPGKIYARSGGKSSHDGNAPVTTEALASAWRASPLCGEQDKTKHSSSEVELKTEFALKQYGVGGCHSTWQHFKWVLGRQYKVTIRNKLFVTARLGAAVMTSLVLGSVWYQLPKEQGFEKLGMLLFCILHISFSNFSELTFSVEQKYVAYKHVDGRVFPALTYIAAWGLIHLPIALFETAVFSLVLYPMVGLVLEAGPWMFFYFNLVLANVAMASFFRIIALLAPNMEAAQTFPGPVIAVFIIFAGFLITPTKMGFLSFMYHVSLFAYALRSLCQNEFLSSSYDKVVAKNPAEYILYMQANPSQNTTAVETLCANGAFECSTMGEAIMNQISIDDDSSYFWGGAMMCGGFWALCFLGSLQALRKVRIQMNIGSSRAGTDAEIAAASNEVAVAIPKSPSRAELAAVANPDDVHIDQKNIEFVPMSIAWRDLEYTVNLAKQAGGGTKQLLQSVTSAAQPERLLALMGASGAGKTTLLDVIAGRKTGGVRKGTIKLNGHEVEKQTFARLTAYCEQMDLHNEFATVEEALEFSAKLRLGTEVSASQRRGFVEEALDILELRPVAGRMIGKSGSANGLSPGQRKVLTVAVELVSNAPVFFLDEPTSGLDSRAALIVMTEVKKVANMGRTVISTIHQPSREIFLMFDDLLLLQRGGWQVYFGPLGPSPASTFVTYMESLECTQGKKLPQGMNPASWMLDVLGGTDSSQTEEKKSNASGAATGKLLDGAELERLFKASAAGAAASELVERIATPTSDSKMFSFASPYAQVLRHATVDDLGPLAQGSPPRRGVQLRPHRRPPGAVHPLRHHLLRPGHERRGRGAEHGGGGFHDHHLHRHHLHERRHARASPRAVRVVPRTVQLYVRRRPLRHRARGDGDPVGLPHRVRHRLTALFPRGHGANRGVVSVSRADQHPGLLRVPLFWPDGRVRLLHDPNRAGGHERVHPHRVSLRRALPAVSADSRVLAVGVPHQPRGFRDPIRHRAAV